MFSEKIDYERIRRLILQNLEQLHSEVFKIKEEVSNLHAWNAVMYRMIYNQSLGNLEKTSKKSKKKSEPNGIQNIVQVLKEQDAIDKRLNQIVKEAQEVVNKNWKNKLSDYKSSI
jgi:hypothetical protein